MSASPTLREGDVVAGRYRVEALVGSGGMASVYRARDEQLHRVVAVKVLDGPAGDAQQVKREQSEARLLASLNHPALVILFDAHLAEDGDPEPSFLVMEFVSGPNLQERISRGALPARDVRRMAEQLAEALSVVHARGVVHRDIKPANVLLAPSPVTGIDFAAKLGDFGIAQLRDSTRLTQVGTVIGTAAYLSPEQATGAKAEPPSDVYSLGLVLLESLTGTKEFPGTLIESLSARLTRDPVVPPSVGTDWSILLRSMLRRDPADRPSAAVVAESLRSFTDTSPAADAATVSFDETPTVAATAVLEPTAVLGEGATERLSSGNGASAAGPSGRHRRRLILGVSAVLVVIIATVVVISIPKAATAPVDAGSITQLDEPLKSDMQALLDAVSP